MEMKDKVRKIVQTENKKNPLTDLEIAKYLSSSRENITNLRKELQIGNSRQRRLPFLKAAVSALQRHDARLSVAELTRALLEQGFNISRKVVEETLALAETAPTGDAAADEDGAVDPFQRLIGSGGSLKNPIEQAKSAILYPPQGLSSLIVGESGVGKSLFARMMYEFAKARGTIRSSAGFVVFNCADYGDNPQLLLSLLFGYKKGAFTGAAEDMPGLVEQADGGVLFLDEIHRLPPKGQEILFSILDRGVFRRLGESTVERTARLTLIGATTENLEAALLLTFRRRIPMVIRLPSLRDRLLAERVELVYSMFQQECDRIHTKIFIDQSVVEVLALNEFGGNIGQLQNTIKVLCAKSFMKFMQQRTERDALVTIDLNEILKLVDTFSDVPRLEKETSQVRKHLRNLVLIPYDKSRISLELPPDGAAQDEADLYQSIAEKYAELRNLKLDEAEIEKLLWAFIVNRFNDAGVWPEPENDAFSLQDLRLFVGEPILAALQESLKELDEPDESKTPERLHKNAFKYLAVHLEEAVRKLRLKQRIENVHTAKILAEFPREYEIARRIADRVERGAGITVPEEEIAYIALYVKSAFASGANEARIGLILISHGRIASETAKVVKALLGIRISMAIDMDLREKPTDVYNRAVEAAKAVEQGRGVLFLVDIGSLTKIGRIVRERTGIETRTLKRMDLLMALEAARKISLGEADLDEIYLSLRKDWTGYRREPESADRRPRAVLTVCLTGEGNARFIADEISGLYPDLRCYPAGVMETDLPQRIERIREESNLLAIVGTIDPQIPGIAFIPYDPVTLKNMELYLSSRRPRELGDGIDERLIVFEPDIYDKRELLEYLCSLLVNEGYVEKEYLESVLHREALLPTYAKGDIAVPHGDSGMVRRTGFVFAKLKSPVDWGVGNIQFLFMPVFTAADQEIVKATLKMLEDPAFMDEAQQAARREDFVRAIQTKIRQMRR